MDAHAATSSKQAINRLRSHMLSITDRVDATSTHMHGDDKTSLSLSLSLLRQTNKTSSLSSTDVWVYLIRTSFTLKKIL
jgi:hypothetical protein